jgi:N-acetylglucosamine-6-sulfatase
MNRRQFLQAAPAAAAVSAAAPSKKRPNFLFIYTDDQRWDAIRALGRQPWLRTPNMDRLVREGANFRNAFVTTSLCSPSRSSYLTGCYPHRTGVFENRKESVLRDDIPVVFEYLRKAGYGTAYVGKVHIPNFMDKDRGCDYVASFPGQGTYVDNKFRVNGKEMTAEGYITDRITGFALDFLKQRDRSKPFAMFVGHKAVHSPFQPDPKYKDLFDKEYMGLPPTWDDTYEGRPSYLKARHKSWHGIEGLLAKYNYSQLQRDIAACLVSVDNSVGQLLQHLAGTGELDDTVIVYSSDNGFFAGEHGLNDKRAMYEDSIKVPFVVRYPRAVKGGTAFDQMVLNIDLAPTMLDFAGLPVPSHMHGRSWKPALEGKDPQGRSHWMYEYHWDKPFPWDPTQFGIRSRTHKYIRYPDVGNTDPTYPMKGELPYEELYDLVHDPLEMRNLAKEPGSAAILAQMRELLRKELADTGYPGGFK